jgi:uncharacterized membrane protein
MLMADREAGVGNKGIRRKLLSLERITPLDLARIMAMLVMIAGHSLDSLANPAELDISLFPWNIWHYIRRFTAPIFLTVSGAVHVFANKRDLRGKLSWGTIKRRIRMAITLTAIGYFFMFPAYTLFDSFFVESKLWVPFFEVNILQLIGFSLLFVLVLFMITRNDIQLGIVSLVLALGITFSSPYISHIGWFKYLPEGMAAYLSSEHGSLFPIFPYTCFMLYGVVLGVILKQVGAEKRTKFLIITGLPVGGVILLAGYLLSPYYDHFSFAVIDKVNPSIILNQIGSVCIVMCFASIIYLITKKLSFYYAFFGKKALFIYIVHLILLFGTGWFPSIARLYPKSLSVDLSILISLLIIVITLGTAYFYEYSMERYRNARKYYRFAFYFILAYFVVIGTFVQLIYKALI